MDNLAIMLESMGTGLELTMEACEAHGKNDWVKYSFGCSDVLPKRFKIIRARILKATPRPPRNYVGTQGIYLAGFNMLDGMENARAKHDLCEVMALSEDGKIKRQYAHDLTPYDEAKFHRATTLCNLVTSYRAARDHSLEANRQYGRWCNEYDVIAGGIWGSGMLVKLPAAEFIEWLKRTDPEARVYDARCCDYRHIPDHDADLEEIDGLFGYEW